ncbi:MAG: T9SS type A sorting domain-containing protein, partial [bacterium]|nr:T9SS type A sorting domain-containing protein [Candidatus Limimorpha caballi]
PSGTEWYDLYLLKVNGDGVVAANGEVIEAVPFLVYPNPASNTLHMDISPDVADQVSEISLFDISGRLLKTQQSGFGSIDISGLAPGLYVMKVTLDDGKVFEEKIVKK